MKHEIKIKCQKELQNNQKHIRKKKNVYQVNDVYMKKKKKRENRKKLMK